MTVTVECPACRRASTISATFAGRELVCPACDGPFVAVPRPLRRRASGLPLVFVGILFGALTSGAEVENRFMSLAWPKRPGDGYYYSPGEFVVSVFGVPVHSAPLEIGQAERYETRFEFANIATRAGGAFIGGFGCWLATRLFRRDKSPAVRLAPRSPPDVSSAV